jgi:hypothetical protein
MSVDISQLDEGYPYATSVSDKTKIKVLEALIPLLEECRDMIGHWNGDEAGMEEDVAHQANDIFETAMELQNKITELEEM